MLKDKLRVDSVVALKAGNSRQVEILRYLISLIDKKALQLPTGKMSEEDELVVLRKELKDKQESREMFAKAGRDDLVAQLDEEIAVVESYLPAQLSEEDIGHKIDEVMGEAGAGANFGQVMGEVMRRLKGQADGQMVAQLVKQKLSERE